MLKRVIFPLLTSLVATVVSVVACTHGHGAEERADTQASELQESFAGMIGTTLESAATRGTIGHEDVGRVLDGVFRDSIIDPAEATALIAARAKYSAKFSSPAARDALTSSIRSPYLSVRGMPSATDWAAPVDRSAGLDLLNRASWPGWPFPAQLISVFGRFLGPKGGTVLVAHQQRVVRQERIEERDVVVCLDEDGTVRWDRPYYPGYSGYSFLTNGKILVYYIGTDNSRNSQIEAEIIDPDGSSAVKVSFPGVLKLGPPFIYGNQIVFYGITMKGEISSQQEETAVIDINLGLVTHSAAQRYNDPQNARIFAKPPMLLHPMGEGRPFDAR